jgi:hypothetical protein
MITRTSTRPVSAEACTSILSQRSSRAGPPMPASVSDRRAPKKKSAATKAMTPSEKRPWPRSPPIQKAPSITRPRKSEKLGMNQRVRYRRLTRSSRGCVLVDMEDLLYLRAEVTGERDRQRQRGRVALLLDRVDRLARDVHRLTELLL